MSLELDLMERVWKRYGVLIAVNGEVKKSAQLKRLEGKNPPETVAALRKMLGGIVDPDALAIFVPESMDGTQQSSSKRLGGKRLEKLADCDESELIAEMFKGWIKTAKSSGSPALVRGLEQTITKLERRAEAAESKIAALVEKQPPVSFRINRVSHANVSKRDLVEEVGQWKARAAELEAEVRTLRSQVQFAQKDMRSAEEAAKSSDDFRMKYSSAMSDNNRLVKSNAAFKDELDQMRILVKRISPDERERLKVEDIEINRQRSAERIESDCTCMGEVENCQRGCNQGKVIKDGHGNVV